jgi:steroid 5-alpha reductase family enzyme
MNYYLILALVLFIYMSCWYFISIIKKRNDVADIAWGLGFILLSWFSFILSNVQSQLSIGVNILVTIWGLRLCIHIYLRNRGKQEDYRYLAWRRQWGNLFFIRSYFQVFILQGIFLYLISLPVLYINQNTGTFSLFSYLGILVWMIGFFFEVVGDWQLTQFIRNPANKGKIIQTGLWRYSRHPNYFGEVTLWWGVFIIALVIPNGIITIVGPLTISCLILFVSGIPLLEKKYLGRANYEEYKKQTSIFFPLPPKKLR